MIRIFVLASMLAMVAACSESTPVDTQDVVQASDSGESPGALVPRIDLFDNPEKAQGRLSSDGEWVSWLAPSQGVLNIWLAPSDNPSAAKVITAETERGIRVHYWSQDSKYILYTQDRGGNENYHVYAVSIENGDIRDLTPVADDARAVIYGISQDRPESVAVGLNDRDRQLFDAYEVNIATGEIKLLAENPGYVRLGVDNLYRVRLGVQQKPNGAQTIFSLDAETPRVLAELNVEDVMTSGLSGFDATNTYAYMIDSRDRDTAALTKVHLGTGEVSVVAADPVAEITGILTNPVTREIRGYQTEYLRSKWHGLDDETNELLERITDAIKGDLSIVSQSRDGTRMVIAADDATQAATYYVYNTQTHQATEMFATRPVLDDVSLQPMQALKLKSRDGLTLVSYLTLPENSDADADGIPDQPLPTVLFVHGGPWARDSYGYNSIHQWLSDRGYAVLSVNYRGSSGFGKNFLNAGKRQFAEKMHDDLIDAVNWAVAQGVSKQDQVAIMGGSYGGYATLVGLTFTPDVFACGVDIVGPSNLITLISSFPEYWRPSLAGNWFAFVGDPANEEEKADMYNRSPIARVADIKAPLLIGQGENDPRVTKGESDQIVEAMQARNLPVTYLNYPDEGHGFARPQNRMSFYATTEAFLSECLGGDYQPIGNDFEGSSVQVLHGAEFIPGLPKGMGAAAQ